VEEETLSAVARRYIIGGWECVERKPFGSTFDRVVLRRFDDSERIPFSLNRNEVPEIVAGAYVAVRTRVPSDAEKKMVFDRGTFQDILVMDYVPPAKALKDAP
jgi:hypothetical protein